MGFNIAGVVINKNYKDNLNQLNEDMGLDFSKAEEITFEVASSNWKEEGICDAYFCEMGTILFMNHENCLEGTSITNGINVFTFAMSEVTMTFLFSYYEGELLVREFMAHEGEKENELGEPLPSEAGTDESGATFNQIGAVLGKSFWDIDLAEKAYRLS
ncbi:hypothetical protein V6R21_13100 [Limibacter armeniacum]|uniref:hypothetical protein n=1 Tax=Limibacter armeniacum TaxID=466084 RepID=UPI002FE6A9A6